MGKWLEMDNIMYGALLLLAFASNISTGGTSIAIVLGAIVMLVQGIKTRQWPSLDCELLKALAIYLLLEAVIAAASFDPGKSFGEVWAIAYRFLPLLFAVGYVKTERELRGIWIAFTLSVLINTLFAAWQLLALHNLRPGGFNNTATFFASHMLMALPILFVTAKQQYMPGWGRQLARVTMFLSFVMLIACGTRGGWIAFTVMLIVFFGCEKRYRKYIAVGGVAIGVFFVGAVMVVPSFQARVSTMSSIHGEANNERLLMWQAALAMTADHPWLGVGQNEFGHFYNTQYISPLAKERPTPGNPDSGHGHPHNNLLKMLAEGGILGLAAFLFIHGYILYRLCKQYCFEKKSGSIVYALMGILIFTGLQIEGLTDTNMNQVPIMREYWLLMGVILATASIKKRE